MLKSELIQRIIELNPTLSESVCRTMVETFFDAITNRLVNGGDVELRGFGRFFLSQYAERTVRNPRTGETFVKEEFAAVRFRSSKSICTRLNADRHKPPTKPDRP
jgi:integration host factor subunit beta